MDSNGVDWNCGIANLKLNTPFRVNVQVNDLATSTNGYYRGDKQQLEIYGSNLIDGYTIEGDDGSYGVQNISGSSQNNGNEHNNGRVIDKSLKS